MSQHFMEQLKIYFPQFLSGMNEGASEEDIQELETRTGFRLPEAFKQLLRIHNGEKEYRGIFMGLGFLSTQEMLRNWNSYRELTDEVWGSVLSFESGKIQEYAYHPGWLPIADDGGGNYLGIDFAPGESGISGQIINYGSDETELFVIADSFGELLDVILEQFRNGNCRVLEGEDEGEFYASWHEDGHVFDDLKELLTSSRSTSVSPREGSLEVDSEFHDYWKSLDENWKSVFLQHAGSAPRSWEEIARIKSLNLLRTGITDLTPLKKMGHLRILIASGLETEDFGALSSLTELSELFLAKTPLADVTPLLPLKNLKRLFIGNTQVRDVRLLRELSSLEELSLENLSIADLAPLRDIPNLKILNVSKIRTQTLHEIGQLKKLIELDIMYLPLDNIGFLGSLSALKDLRISSSRDGDYSVLAKLTRMKSMTCEFCVFKKTRSLWDVKISYTISGEMTDEEHADYHEYVMS
ncbi:SMI1/KNR4 family protein [Paenibacillus lutrae]|uniref:SMI1/KNR4 family protein n=1 Tax=Paenibacillus lutrae TaxID=2078573 RepID=A0A7X3K0J2_9BACL|nr:SMI1/KNR4 family protein [Paenibacillus lutrae]MVP01147.1 SMI1/KNR4 family protein [Paenibacillus lutrae]